MGMYKYIRQVWKNPREGLGDLWMQRLIKWRREPATIRIERPTRIDRARSLGYKAKPGYVIVRQRVIRGGRQRPQLRNARRPKAKRRRKVLKMNYQTVAEARAAKDYRNCEVLNSYLVADDGKYYWYEIILVDRNNPSILADHRINWVLNHKGRANRGITSSARRSRGLHGKGKGHEKARPSLNANKGRGN